MTNTHDLSLLTDDEREKHEMALKLVRDLGPMNIGIDAMDDLRVMAFIADAAFTALIAARAENKRKDDAIAAAANAVAPYLCWACGENRPIVWRKDIALHVIPTSDGGEYEHTCDAQAVRTMERMVLQSEKGGE